MLWQMNIFVIIMSRLMFQSFKNVNNILLVTKSLTQEEFITQNIQNLNININPRCCNQQHKFIDTFLEQIEQVFMNLETSINKDVQIMVFQSNQQAFTSTQPIIDCISKRFDIFNIFFFELGAMILFSYCVIIFNGITTFPGVWIVWLGMAISLGISATFGYGHINPAVTFAFMIKKQGRTPILNAILLVISQFIGAFIGTFIAWSLNQQLLAPFPSVHSLDTILPTFGKEITGSMLFVLCILILVSKDTQFTTNDIQIWLAIPMCLIAVCVLFNLGLGTNPAQALAFQVAYYVFVPNPDSGHQLSSIWSVVIGASIGGFLAGLIFEFVYRRYSQIHRQQLVYGFKPPMRVQLLPKNQEKKPLEDFTVKYRKTQIQIP